MKFLFFVLGVIIGAAVVYFGIERRFTRSITYSSTFVRAANDYRALSYLRTNNIPEAIEELESDLDIELMSLIAFKDTRLNASTTNILRRVAAYRKQFPRKTEYPETDSAVQEVLSFPKN